MTRRTSQSSSRDAAKRSPSTSQTVGPTFERVSPQQLYIYLTGHPPAASSLPNDKNTDDVATSDFERMSKRPRLGEDNDGASIWEERAEVCFLTCIAHIPPLERQKVMFFGKPCGRNEVIALVVSLATGNLRHRKQVSSHAQVIKGRPGLHPYLAALFEPENHAPLEESSTIGNAVVLHFPRVLYDFMGMSTEVDLATAKKPEWFVAAEQDLGLNAKDNDTIQEAKSAKHTATNSSSARTLRNSSLPRDRSHYGRVGVTSMSASSSQVQFSVPAESSIIQRCVTASGPSSGLREGDFQTSAPQIHGSSTLSITPQDITVWSRCGGLLRCLASCTFKSSRSRSIAVDDIPLVDNRFGNIREDLQTGCPVIHVEVPLRIPRLASHRVAHLHGLIDVSIVVNMTSFDEKRPNIKVAAAGGFNDRCLFREEALQVQELKDGSRPQAWQGRATLNTKVLNNVLTSPGLDVDDLLLPHVWVRQSITTCGCETALLTTAPLHGVVVPGEATIVLLYTFTIGDGDVRFTLV